MLISFLFLFFAKISKLMNKTKKIKLSKKILFETILNFKLISITK